MSSLAWDNCSSPGRHGVLANSIDEQEPWKSRSTTRTLRGGLLLSLNGLAKKAARFAVRVDLPTPPFRLAIVRTSLLRFRRVSIVLGGCGLCLIVSHNPGPCSSTAARARAIFLMQSHQDGKAVLA